MSTPTDKDLGKAYKAWQAFNFKQKLDRVHFDQKRWLRVVHTILGGENGNSKLSKQNGLATKRLPRVARAKRNESAGSPAPSPIVRIKRNRYI